MVFAAQTKAVCAYSESAESWKPDHDLAMAQFQFDDLLKTGLKLLLAIKTAHTEWQGKVLSGEADPCLDVDLVIWDLYAWWLRPVERVEKELAFFEGEGFRLEHAAQFREELNLLRDDRQGLSRPKTALRPFTPEELEALSM